MNKISLLLEKFKYGIVLFLAFLVPFSFLPFFQNLIPVNIVYFFVFGAILLFIISFLQLLIGKKLTLHTTSLDLPIIIFLCGIFLSFLITSTNKMQALLDPNMGPMIIAALSIFYFYGRQYAKNNLFSSILSLSAFIISSFIIVFSLEPSKSMGIIPLELIVFFGFILLYNFGSLIHSFSSSGDEQASKVVQICILIVISIAFIIGFVGFLKQEMVLPSFSLSFKAVLETVKHPLTALFGVGIDNYSPVFTRIKDIAYNQTNLWAYSSQNADRSVLFHVATTTGIIGLVSFLYLLFSLIKKTYFSVDKKIKQNFSIMLGLTCLLCMVIIFPPSLLVFFLLFFLASQIKKEQKEYVFNLSKSFSLYSYLILIITACVLFGAAVRYLGSLYLADYFYTQSLVGMKENKFNKVYNNQKRALSYNPYLEQYHFGFARTHFVLAQNIMDKAASGSADANNQKSLVFTKESKQMLIEAIQFAISENQVVIDLNPKKAEYWANLAQIYTIIPKELQSSEDKEANSPQTIAVNLFNKALVLDPNNPAYYFRIGQLYLAQQKTDDGFKYIKKAVGKKSNWADAHYQLAMLYGQKQDKNNMIKELQTTLQNLDPKTQQKEYDATKQLLDKINASQQQQQPNNPTPPQGQDQLPPGQPPVGQPPAQTNNLPPQ